MCNCDYEVSGLFTDGELDLDIELMAGVLIGAVAADKADEILNKVEFLAANANAREGVKVAAGFLLTQFGMNVLTGAGYGMMAIGGARLIGNLLGGSTVSGIENRGQYGTEPPTVYGLNMPGQQGTDPNIVFGMNNEKKINVRVWN